MMILTGYSLLMLADKVAVLDLVEGAMSFAMEGNTVVMARVRWKQKVVAGGGNNPC